MYGVNLPITNDIDVMDIGPLFVNWFSMTVDLYV